MIDVIIATLIIAVVLLMNWMFRRVNWFPLMYLGLVGFLLVMFAHVLR